MCLERASVDTNEETKLEQLVDFVRRAGEAVDHADLFGARIVLVLAALGRECGVNGIYRRAEDVDKVAVCGSGMQKQGQLDLCCQGKLGCKVFLLHLGRREMQPVIVQATLAHRYHLARSLIMLTRIQDELADLLQVGWSSRWVCFHLGRARGMATRCRVTASVSPCKGKRFM